MCSSYLDFTALPLASVEGKETRENDRPFAEYTIYNKEYPMQVVPD